MTPPETYVSLESRDLLHHETLSRLSTDCLWFEGVRWLNTLGPSIELPKGSSMIPFAISAYGDWWCWEFEKNSNALSSVILSPPDTGDCTYYAPSFEAFLFRQILDFTSNDVFCDAPDPDEIRFTIAEIHEQLDIWIEQLRPYFPSSWIDVLVDLRNTGILSTHVHSRNYQYRCLLTPERQAQIEGDLLRHAKMGKSFKFDRLAIDWYGD